MATVRDSLYVHGNMPCPSPTYSPPPSRFYHNDNHSRPVKYSSNKGPPMNTDEELRNILRQAKTPILHGPTLVAKRNEYFKKIKTLNDGMYNQTCPPIESLLSLQLVDDFVLEGKKVDENSEGQQPQGQTQGHEKAPGFEFVDLDGRETIYSATGMPHRSVRYPSPSKSAKSFKSFYSSHSEPAPRPYRSITLPQLTIGSSRNKTKADYKDSVNEPLSIIVKKVSADKDPVENEGDDDFAIAEYRFPSTSPRRILKAGERTPRADSSGNYGSMTVNDLKACLHIQQPQQVKEDHEEYVLQDYATQFKQAQQHAKKMSKSKRGSASVNPYKLMKAPRKSKPISHRGHASTLSSRYEFKNVDSYLKFNKHQQENAAAVAAHGQNAQAQVYSDTLLLKMMTDLNKPADHARQSANMAAVRLSNSTADADVNTPRARHVVVPCNSPVNRKPINTGSHVREKAKEVIQHIVYVPSGQTAKVRLLKG